MKAVEYLNSKVYAKVEMSNDNDGNGVVKIEFTSKKLVKIIGAADFDEDKLLLEDIGDKLKDICDTFVNGLQCLASDIADGVEYNETNNIGYIAM
jgi:hypothetical protein